MRIKESVWESYLILDPFPEQYTFNCLDLQFLLTFNFFILYWSIAD